MIINYEDIHRYDDIKDLKKNRCVDRLFRFIPFNSDKSLNEIKLDTLENNCEHISSPLNFNDPYDCELSFNLLDGLEDFLKIGFNREVRRSIKKDKQKE